MIPDSLAPGIVIRAPNKTSARESGDEAKPNQACATTNAIINSNCVIGVRRVAALVGDSAFQS